MEEWIRLETRDESLAICGNRDRNLRRIREAFGVSVTVRNGGVRLVGDPDAVREAAGILATLVSLYRNGVRVSEASVDRMLDEARAEEKASGPEATVESLVRTAGQRRYVEAIRAHDLVFAIGPAGTGKTYLAVKMAILSLRAGRIRRLVLCRPAVEAGEKLGFLPGDFHAKVHPYLQPLYDALHDILDYDQVKRHMEREVIEVVPLAYMRGRTLNNAFIILDEAQNTTPAQMKMFLTRMGENSKIVVTGDITQIDLPGETESGLIQVSRIVRGIEGTAWVELDRSDIVRHPLVKRIVEAYERVSGE
ncbi:MAG: PhoH family protein [Planctomycetes bacterium]|nr:PhoH family protein [Planctomycetota bacterium]